MQPISIRHRLEILIPPKGNFNFTNSFHYFIEVCLQLSTGFNMFQQILTGFSGFHCTQFHGKIEKVIRKNCVIIFNLQF